MCGAQEGVLGELGGGVDMQEGADGTGQGCPDIGECLGFTAMSYRSLCTMTSYVQWQACSRDIVSNDQYIKRCLHCMQRL